MTITATNSYGDVSQTIMVTVNAAPVVVPAVTWKKEIPDVTFEHDGAPQMFMLADYFNDATMYDTDHGDGTVVTAEVNDEQTMLTLTRVGPGTATVEVTPSNSVGDGVAQSITVTVNSPDAVVAPPKLKTDKDIPEEIKVTALTQEEADALDPVNTPADLVTLNAAEESYMLSDLIRDPVGPDADLVFSTETDDPKTVAVYATPADTGTDGNADERSDTSVATLDKMMTDASSITIRGRKAGKATVTITATGDAGVSMSWPIVVMVGGSNNAPDLQSGLAFPGTDATDENFGKFVGLDGIGRLKSTATKEWKEKLDLGLIFDDDDVQVNSRITGDSWMLKAMSSKKDVVTVRLESTNNNEKPDERYVILTPVGPGDARIYFTATDSFGESAGGLKDPADASDPYVDNTDFGVKVNNRPQTYSAHDKESERKTLAEVTTTKDLTISSSTAVEVRLTDDTTSADEVEGYFSDKDGDPLKCRYVENDRGEGTTTDPGVATIAWGGTAADRNTLSVTPTNLGTMTVDVWCFDQVGASGSETDFERSDKATLTVTVIYTASIRD